MKPIKPGTPGASLPHLTPVALAMALMQGMAMAQPAQNTTSADVPDATSLFETGGQQGIGPRPFTSFFERLSTPVDKILIKVAGNNLSADGVTGTDVNLQLLDGKGMPLAVDVDVTIEVDGGARILLPGRKTSESGADRGDIDRIQPGIQYTVKNGALAFKLIAPYKPDPVTLKVSVKGVVEKVIVRYVPDLREMLAVGLVEGRLRSDKFDPRVIVPVRENDGFDNELRGFTKDFNGGRTNLGARAAMYLKGKVKGDYLLTLAYDSDKDTRKILFQDVDPNAFYPVYGDSSVRGVDAQSSGKLYVRIDNKLSYLLYGDFTTIDANPARSLSQYSRSLSGLRAHYEEGRITGNAFLAQQTSRQVIDEFPARGVSGPYSVSNPNGVTGSEKVEIVVRDRNQTSLILKTTALTRNADYEFEPFSGQILFKSPVPSYDDQLNPVSIRVTYEVDQGGEKFLVYGGDARLKLSDVLSVGVSMAKDRNPAAPYEITGANLHLKLSQHTEVIAEVAHTNSVVNTNASGYNANTSSNFINRSGEMTGSAARVEVRHSDEDMRLRGYAVRATDGFNNTAGGITGGRSEYGASGAYKVNRRLTLNGEYIHSEDDIADTRRDASSVGADLKLSDRLTVGGGVRRVSQNAASLTSLTGNTCSSGTGGGSSGYNNGYGINQQGNQQIDPATGQPVVCSPTTLSATTTAPVGLDRTSLYGRATYRLTDTVMLSGELQREFGTDSTTLYRLGADWQVAEKTRLYSRLEHSRSWGGAYGLGVGAASDSFAMGIDTQYMQDGSLFSEYRLLDGDSGKTVQAALGLRNGWRLAEGLRMLTSVERVTGPTGNASAAGVGLEYTASELWKGSGRMEWRQDANNTNWLLTLGLARKLDSDWTMLARDYANLVQPRTAAGSNKRQNRFQVGFAYRPVDNNKFDALGLYERKVDNDLSAGTDSRTDIISLRTNYHPSRPWWLSGRYAYKQVNELLLGTVNDSYRAQLFGARVTYDITNRWSIGALFSVLQGQGGARQYAYGLEAGYVLMDNLLVTVGYNWRGFSDKDLTASDYTNRGWVLGVRYKFDEDLFRKNDPTVNKTLNPTAAPAQP
ncbi:hypothetical protein [Variovorax terrae]|uniref:Outer membrane protein beta-barrel domain-containing protein n=1 Tax=Variovorax terrae TaxID=2923278 RepID=A0A9X2AS04_9BURK|nr:hypothetical protein [Variovorax terrae]MCJ0764721.1 hypothetical protein [Variovorax terrae]